MVENTALIDFVQGTGYSFLARMTAVVYDAPLYKFVLLISLCISLVYLALSIKNRSFHPNSLSAFIAIFLASPLSIPSNDPNINYGRYPLLFSLVDISSKAIQNSFMSGVMASITDDTSKSSVSNMMPPGYIVDTLINVLRKASSPDVINIVSDFTQQCLEGARNIHGIVGSPINSSSPSTFKDLFAFKIKDDIDSIQCPYATPLESSAVFEPSQTSDISLRNLSIIFTKIPYIKGTNTRPMNNCFQYYQYTIGSVFCDSVDVIKNDTDNDLITVDKVYKWYPKDSDSLNSLTQSEWVESSKSNHNVVNINKVFSSTRSALTFQYARNSILNDSDYNWSIKSRIAPSINVTREAVNSTISDASFFFKTLEPSTALDSRWSFSLGAKSAELREMLELLPFRMAVTKIVLILLCPIVVILLYLKKYRLVYMWILTWFITDITKPIIDAIDFVSSSIIISQVKLLNNPGNINSYFSINVLRDMLSDIVPLTYSLVSIKMAIINLLLTAMLLGSYMVSGPMSAITRNLGQMATNMIISRIAPAISANNIRSSSSVRSRPTTNSTNDETDRTFNRYRT